MKEIYEISMSMAVVFEIDLFHMTVPLWLVDYLQYFGKGLSTMTSYQACSKQSMHYAGTSGAVVCVKLVMT